MTQIRLLQCAMLAAMLGVYGGVRVAHAAAPDHDHGDHGNHGHHGDDDEQGDHDWRGDDHHNWDDREGPGKHGRGHAYGHYKHPGYHFRDDDVVYFRGYYPDAERYRYLRDRQRYYEGEMLEGDWREHIRPVPVVIVRELPPPPPGYVFGYSDGYAVAYNPTTRIIADVIDLAGAISHH